MASVTGSVIRVDEQELRGHLDEVVRTSVEETLNGMLDAEADRLCQAKRYERTAERMDTRAGSYERKLQTKAGEVKLKVPRSATGVVSRAWKRLSWRCTWPV